ncbi:hypothetical protein HK101_007549 [Irineochytrium annulatum]|nr:hypothetical protein HK101_007549 [Irineochytrium annulatum]
MTTRTEDLDELFAMPDMTLNRATVDTSRALSPAIEASTRDEMSGVEYAVVKELPVVAVAVTGQAQLDPMAQDAEDREMDDDFASEQLELAELEPERPHPLQKKRAEAEEPEQQEPEPQRPEPGDREPKQLVPKQSATRQPGRQQPEPAQRGPQLAEPKQAEQKDAEPKQIEPKHAKPKQANPELAKSKQAEPKAAAPQEAAPKEAGLQQTEILPPEREPMEVEKEVSEPEEPQSDSASEKKRKRRSSHSVDPDAEIDSPDEDEAEFDEEDEPAARKNASKRQKSITKSSRVTIHDPLDNSEDDDMDLAQRQKKLRSAGLSKSQTLVALKASPKRRRTRNQHDELPLAEESAPEEPPVAPEKPGTKGDMTVEKVTDEFIRTGSWEVGDPHAPWHARLKYGDTIDVFYNEEPKTWYHSRVLYYIRYTDSDKTFLKVHYSGYQKKFDRIFDIRDPVTAQHLRPPDKDTEIEAEVAVAAARETYVAEDKEAYGLSHPDINKGHREAVINGKVVVSNKQMPKQKRKSIAG